MARISWKFGAECQLSFSLILPWEAPTQNGRPSQASASPQGAETRSTMCRLPVEKLTLQPSLCANFLAVRELDESPQGLLVAMPVGQGSGGGVKVWVVASACMIWSRAVLRAMAKEARSGLVVWSCRRQASLDGGRAHGRWSLSTFLYPTMVRPVVIRVSGMGNHPNRGRFGVVCHPRC
jgi:hypothetical protein